ncbi:hypothetical protein QBC34DRAFT_387564 [Podospora aff. communis PSN243]|uniref:Uncharacterized protein n=1 Tax=Podospora aff. communis PSN243 TaxID=3040156 RepID=A0AAV9G446_9PEZI|nr:hypothetical protein QBC34DRAFT_387564 [Podospora aff. communis PSN243]
MLLWGKEQKCREVELVTVTRTDGKTTTKIDPSVCEKIPGCEVVLDGKVEEEEEEEDDVEMEEGDAEMEEGEVKEESEGEGSEEWGGIEEEGEEEKGDKKTKV